MFEFEHQITKNEAHKITDFFWLTSKAFRVLETIQGYSK
jgi:hypothetical protein